jgi:hypothetical protein
MPPSPNYHHPCTILFVVAIITIVWLRVIISDLQPTHASHHGYFNLVKALTTFHEILTNNLQKLTNYLTTCPCPKPIMPQTRTAYPMTIRASPMQAQQKIANQFMTSFLK